MLLRNHFLSAIGFAALIALAAAAGVARADLIANWTLDETSGSAAADASGKGHAGTLVNAPTIGQTGAVGKAYSFDGTNDYISVSGTATDLYGMNALTMCVWVNMTDPTRSNQRIINKSSWYQPGISYYMAMDAADAMPTSRTCVNQTWNGYSKSTTAVTASTWHQLTYTFGLNVGTGVYDNKFYIDGVQTYSGTSSGGVVDGNAVQNLWLGVGPGKSSSNNVIGSSFFLGLMDDTGLWSEVLTTERINAIYNTPRVGISDNSGLYATGLYNLTNMKQLFDVYADTLTSTTIGELTWQKATNLTGHNPGEAWTDGTYFYVQLGGDATSGSGVATIPEPGTMALLVCGLFGLLAYARRKRM
jgi:hypothetical protein